jgi:transcriptional regulator with XRE-family HTH domain
MTDDETFERVARLLKQAYADSPSPPPFFEESLKAMRPSLETIREEEVRAGVEAARAALFPSAADSLGSLIRRRRAQLGADLEDVAATAGWDEGDLESLERDRMDLARTEPDRLARLLRVLRLDLDDVREALRALAERHLAIRRLPGGHVFGRTRQGVTSAERREDLTRGLGEVDREATSRQVEAYLRDVEEALEDLEG